MGAGTLLWEGAATAQPGMHQEPWSQARAWPPHRPLPCHGLGHTGEDPSPGLVTSRAQNSGPDIPRDQLPPWSQESSRFYSFAGKLHLLFRQELLHTKKLHFKYSQSQIQTQLFIFFNCKQVLKKRSKSEGNILKLLG